MSVSVTDRLSELLTGIENALKFGFSGDPERGSFLRRNTSAYEYVPSVFLTLEQFKAEILSLRQARDTAEQERQNAKEHETRACEMAGEERVARSKVEAEAESYRHQLAAVDAERIALQQEVEELRATIGTLDAL